jgi:hypothetical protein
MNTQMKKCIVLYMSCIFFGFSTSLFAWEIHPAKKIYFVYAKERDTNNSTNVIARIEVSSPVGNLSTGPLIVELLPNITSGGIINTPCIEGMIPSIVALCDREYPDQPIETFSLEVSLIKDLWNEYREFFLANAKDAPGKIEFKSSWFQQKSIEFVRSNQKISSLRKAVVENVDSLQDPIAVIPDEIHFVREAIGLSWNLMGGSPRLYIVSPVVISFISKGPATHNLAE